MKAKNKNLICRGVILCWKFRWKVLTKISRENRIQKISDNLEIQKKSQYQIFPLLNNEKGKFPKTLNQNVSQDIILAKHILFVVKDFPKFQIKNSLVFTLKLPPLSFKTIHDWFYLKIITLIPHYKFHFYQNFIIWLSFYFNNFILVFRWYT